MADERDLELVCTLRENAQDPTRTRVKSWVNEYALTRGLKNFQAREVCAVAWRGLFDQRTHSTPAGESCQPHHCRHGILQPDVSRENHCHC